MGNRAVCVGGGIAGMLAAVLLKEKFRNVILIEKAGQLGGLLSSQTNERGEQFDYGTHLLSLTGVSELDSLLYGSLSDTNWNVLQNESAGNFSFGKLGDHSPFIDARLLGNELYEKGWKEFLTITSVPESHASLQNQLENTFGRTFTEGIFGPPIRKHFGLDLSANLAPDSHLLFGLKRIIAATSEKTRELKKTQIHDQRLAFHSSKEGVSSGQQFYPKSGGIGCWADRLISKVQAAGCEIVYGKGVSRVSANERKIDSIELDDGSLLDCDLLVWTIPPIGLLRSAQETLPSYKPNFRHTALFHFVLDEPPQSQSYYIWGHDPNILPFRVTLYSNFQKNSAFEGRRHRVTVEVLSESPLDIERALEQIPLDLRKMSIFSEKAQVLFSQGSNLGPSFPVLTTDYFSNAMQVTAQLTERFSNCLLLGKASGSVWFMNDVLKQTYTSVKSL